MEAITVIIPCENKMTHTLVWKDFHALDFTSDSPFQLTLTDDQVFVAEKMMRIVPRKRLVAYGTWQGKEVIAKLFFDKEAKQHWESEIAGVKLLIDNRVPTPTLLHQCKSKDGRVYVLFFEYIANAKSLDDIWHHKNNIHAVMPLLKSVVVELATQHVFGLLQHDLHLKNFLIRKNKHVYMLDGAEVELSEPLLPKKVSMQHLALFLAQLGVGVESYQEILFKHYAKSRGWLSKEEDKNELFFLIRQWNEQRWKKFAKKIMRNSSNFANKKDSHTFAMYDRQYAKPEWLAFLHDPESAFHHPTMTMLKNGRSSTVVKVMLDQCEFVVKRYNMKNKWHFLRRCLRPTRAFAAWRLAQKLSLFCLPTAKPVAFIEKRLLGLRGKSYYVTEYVSGKHIGDFFAQYANDEEKISMMVKRIVALLKSMARLEITHGDLKMTNILIDESEQPFLIDFDGAVEHLSLASLRQAWKHEIKRLLDNFQDLPNVKEAFQKTILVQDEKLTSS